jgi:hypothetical protein
MPSVNTLLARHAVDQSIAVLRVSASVKRDVMGVLGRLEDQLTEQLASTKLTGFSDRRYRSMMASVRELSTGAYDKAAEVTARAVERVMTYVVEDIGGTVKSLTGIDLFGRVADPAWIASVADKSLTQGATNDAWWAKQNTELVFKFEQQVKLGMVANETTDKIIARIRSDGETPGVLYQTRANAAALVQTSIAEGANDARLEMYRANADIIRGVQQVSTLDDRTTDVCMAYDLAAWDLDGEPIDGTDLPFDGGPPRHWNCRSTLVPIVKSSEELGTNIEVLPGMRASMDGAVSDKMSFNDWLATKSEAQQDNILGAGRAQLFRDGKITMRDLVNQDGRPLTLEQLRSTTQADFSVLSEKELAKAKRDEYSRQKAEAKDAGVKFVYREPASLQRGGPAIEPSSISQVGRVGELNIDYTGAIKRKDFDYVANNIKESAENLGFPLEKITVSDGSARTIVFEGRETQSAGFAVGDRIVFNADTLSSVNASRRSIDPIVAHEVQHVKFNAISADAEVASYISDNFAALREDDGVTAYSTSFWKRDTSTTEGRRKAITETLSEIAAIENGKRASKEVSEAWQTLYDAINLRYVGDGKP